MRLEKQLNMANPAKQKGTSFETLIRTYLNDNGFPIAHRTVLKGGGDTGDINGIRNKENRQVAVQCKNQKAFSLSKWLNDTVEQAKNLKGVLVATQLLSTMGWKLTATKVFKALLNVKKNTGLMGRWECIQNSPRIILDVAHNEHGIHALLEQLETIHFNQLHIITGMVKDKDVDAVLKLLPATATYYYTQSHIPRALSANELAAKGKALGHIGDTYEDVNLAIAVANKNANHNDLILVIGSVFLVAEVNRQLLPTFLST